MLNRHELIELYQHSEKNRMLFYYLERARMLDPHGFSAVYESENAKRLRIDDSISKVSRTLSDEHIEHAVFKTIRPYRCTTVDIDVIIFGDYVNAAEVMKDAGYSLVVQGPMSTTMKDQEVDIGIDLYDHVAVSSITYIDKRKLIDSITETILWNKRPVRTLKPEADLICVIAHSMIKEQMYTLAEYYTFIYYLEQINVGKFLRKAEQTNTKNAIKTHAAITALLHKSAHGTVPDTLREVLDTIGRDDFEAARLQKRGYDTPHKYHPYTISKCLIEVLKQEETRKSLAKQLSNMFDPNFANDFLRKLVQHLFRETY